MKFQTILDDKTNYFIHLHASITQKITIDSISKERKRFKTQKPNLSALGVLPDPLPPCCLLRADYKKY